MKRILMAAVLSLPLLAAAEPGYVAEATELRDGPYADGKTVLELPAAAAVEIRGRQGGWYQVQSGQQQGWVRMSALRLKAPGAQVGMLQGGRAAATQSVSTTAVRGFGKGELLAASPNLPAVDALENSAVSAPDARSFAAQASLQAKADKGGNE